MATDASLNEATTGAHLEGHDTPAPAAYRRSWVNVVIDRVQQLPGPAWLTYVVASLLALLFVASTDWLSGVRFPELQVDTVEWAAVLVGPVALIHYLDEVARASLREFTATLDTTPGTVARLEHEMTVIPAQPALLILLFAVFRTAEGFAFQPATESIVGKSPLTLALRAPFEILSTAVLVTLLYHTIRQLQLVRHIHAMAAHVDLFRSVPLYAFSRLTSRTAIGLVPLVIPFGLGLLRAKSTLEFVSIYALSSVILGLAVLAFTVPLVGMHRRMSAEKKRLQMEVGGRIEALIGDLHAAVDRRDLSLADGQNKQLGSLIAERDLVNHLSTWPWQAGTVGAVASAIILPIVIAFFTRLLVRIV